MTTDPKAGSTTAGRRSRRFDDTAETGTRSKHQVVGRMVCPAGSHQLVANRGCLRCDFGGQRRIRNKSHSSLDYHLSGSPQPMKKRAKSIGQGGFRALFEQAVADGIRAQRQGNGKLCSESYRDILAWSGFSLVAGNERMREGVRFGVTSPGEPLITLQGGGSCFTGNPSQR